MPYPEEDYLALSGIQHFAFCRRQWALIHIETGWEENLLTAEGRIEHRRCHDEKFVEKRGGILTVRGLRVHSPRLGVSGQCDVVEFSPSENGEGAALAGRCGTWRANPVEYKHGQAKSDDADRLQLCCQAMCLEEMLGCAVDSGDLFYEKTHRREKVIFDAGLRETVEKMLKEMHDLFRRGHTPRTRPNPGCRSCSLAELCLPKLAKSGSAAEYYRVFIN